ncbi:RNA polymerase sigma factor [Mariniblastus fucicola]|uniref:RNA polymerase sigma factor n=1 Tax=Mariniblastus fucicola TaxID=980251 RepID=UPI0012F85D3B|nr:sigma-70 family RNA polymerase sigma factor [Mariniblastus fucicola]
MSIYQPLIEKWLVRFGAPSSDLNDLSQNVLAVVVRKLPEFRHAGREGAFRSWVRNITRNCLLEFWRAKKIQPIATGKTSFQETLNQLKSENSELSQQWNREYDQQVLATLLRQIENDFRPGTWDAFKRVAVDGAKPADVAKELNVTVNSIFIAKSRVMARLRVVGRHLID